MTMESAANADVVEVTRSSPVNSPRHAPIFDKALRFTRADQLRELGLYPYFRCIESAQDTEVLIDGRKLLMLGSNSYMGLTNDPRVKEAVKKAVDEYGSGCAGSRFLNGTLRIHVELEEEIADFMNKERALTFTTGMQANLGVIAALLAKDDHVFVDRADHASIIDGCRLGFGKVHKFRHNDVEDLERVLRLHDATGKLIVIDGVYSMEGDLARLPEITALARRCHAGIVLDDAHGIGVLGTHGQGTASHFGLENEIELIAGTFSKSVASIGGFVAGDAQVIDYLKHHARALIFSASMAPACVAAARAALRIIRDEPERRTRLWENTEFLRGGLQHMGFDTGCSQTPIIPVVIGETMTCFRFWAELHDAGVFVNPVVAPATPPDRALIRLSVMATHTREQLAFALDRIESVARRLGILRPV